MKSGGKSFLLLCLLVSVVTSSKAPTAAATPVSLVGAVRNGTQGAGLPAVPLVVTAIQLNDSNSETDRRTGEAKGDGSFRFDGFDLERGRRFVVGVDYQGVTYSQLIEARDDGTAELHGELKIHEQTDDETVIRVVSDILTIVGGGEGTFEVIQLMRVENKSDRTYVGRVPLRESQNAAVLTFPVPQGSFEVTPLEGLTGERMVAARQGFTSGDPVLPGETKYSYIYKVRVPRTGWDLQREVIYSTARSEILVADDLMVVSEEFEYQERRKVGGRFYRRYRGGAWQAGATWPVRISSNRGAGPGVWIGVGIGLALVGSAGAASILLRRRKDRAEPPTPKDRENLVEAIARLDVRFERGEIDKDQYEKTRRGLKKKLAEMSEI